MLRTHHPRQFEAVRVADATKWGACSVRAKLRRLISQSRRVGANAASRHPMVRLSFRRTGHHGVRMARALLTPSASKATRGVG